MKQDTLEGKAKTKNGVKRLCFSMICILLEVIFIITIVTRLNEYAEKQLLSAYILSFYMQIMTVYMHITFCR